MSAPFGATGQLNDASKAVAESTVSFSPMGSAHALLREIAADLIAESDNIALTMVHAYEAEIPTYNAIVDPWPDFRQIPVDNPDFGPFRLWIKY